MLKNLGVRTLSFGPFGEFDVTLSSLCSFNLQIWFQRCTQQASGNVGIVNVCKTQISPLRHDSWTIYEWKEKSKWKLYNFSLPGVFFNSRLWSLSENNCCVTVEVSWKEYVRLTTVFANFSAIDISSIIMSGLGNSFDLKKYRSSNTNIFLFISSLSREISFAVYGSNLWKWITKRFRDIFLSKKRNFLLFFLSKNDKQIWVRFRTAN